MNDVPRNPDFLKPNFDFPADESQWNVTAETRKLTAQRRKALLRAGLSVMPAGGKGQLLIGWPDIVATEWLIDRWSNGHVGDRYPNTSIIATTTPGVDIDVSNEEWVKELLFIFIQVCGLREAPMVRFGREPRLLIPCQTDIPFPKMSVTCKLIDGVKHAVEILGNRHQWVAEDIHEKTAKPYRWAGGDPLKIGRTGLPKITGERAKTFIELATACFVAKGLTIQSKSNSTAPLEPIEPRTEAPEEPWTKEAEAFYRHVLSFVPRAIDYNGLFLPIITACNSLGWDEVGFQMFKDWCVPVEAGGYDERVLRKKWNSFTRKRGGGRTFNGMGAVVVRAKENGWDGSGPDGVPSPPVSETLGPLPAWLSRLLETDTGYARRRKLREAATVGISRSSAPPKKEELGEPKIKVGDWIEGAINGTLFPHLQVRAIETYEDGSLWVLVEGHATSIPIAQVRIVPAPPASEEPGSGRAGARAAS